MNKAPVVAADNSNPYHDCSCNELSTPPRRLQHSGGVTMKTKWLII
jgi:hypothetical protein